MTSPVATFHPHYLSNLHHWMRNRAVVSGTSSVLEWDRFVNNNAYTNMLVPFSAKMTQENYDIYKSEAEFPELTGEYIRIVLGGLLRKEPSISYEDSSDIFPNTPELLPMVQSAVEEELTTNRCWVAVYWNSQLQKALPRVYRGENVINWQQDLDNNLLRVVIRYLYPHYENYQTDHLWMIEDHYLAYNQEYEQVCYHLDTYREDRDLQTTPEIVNPNLYNINIQEELNRLRATTTPGAFTKYFESEKVSYSLFSSVVPLKHGEPLTEIPVIPLNGHITPITPMISGMVHKELALYNKTSRRNHLLYSSGILTPMVFASSSQEVEDQLDRGLGTIWILPVDSKVDILQTPTGALSDFESAIGQNVESISRLGIRLLSNDNTYAQSGVALTLRNSPQIAQLSLFNTRVSRQFEKILNLLEDYNRNPMAEPRKMSFSLTQDFDPTPLGSEWLRLITEMYESKMLPRSAWIDALKRNDILADSYNDQEGVQEIQQDPLVYPQTNFPAIEKPFTKER